MRMRRAPAPARRALACAQAIAFVPMLLIVSCGGPRMTAPEGFAPLEKRLFDNRAYVLRAMSPEGMRFQVRAVKNDPRQDLGFWAEALRAHLAKEGYRTSSEPQGFRTAGPGNRAPLEGRFFEWTMPYGTESWSYLTAVLVAGKRILVAEAAGERAIYAKHRAAVLASLQSLAP